MNKDQVKILRAKIFLKFNHISYTDLAKRIDELTRAEGLFEASSTTRQAVYQVVMGRMKTPRIRKYLAQLLDELPETLWPETVARKKKLEAR
jgi:hypothetical protein